MDLSGHDALTIEPSRALIERPTSHAGRVLFGAVLAAAAVAALPASLIDLAIGSLGLSEAMPWLAPPLGWAARIALALSAGLVTAALLLISGKVTLGESPSRPPRERTDRMTSATAFGWQRLASFARGEASAPARRTRHEADEMKWRRADLHPDAPPRAPLFASRDLPVGVFETADSDESASDPSIAAPLTGRQPPFLSTGFDPARPPVRDLSRHDRPRPLPRSPEPLSDEEVEALRALLRAIPEPEPSPAPAVLQEDAPVTPPLAVEQDAPLSALLGRFEKSVEERIALADAQDAAARLDQTLNRSADEQLSQPEKPAPETVDQALRDALEALRVLSAGKRGRGARR